MSKRVGLFVVDSHLLFCAADRNRVHGQICQMEDAMREVKPVVVLPFIYLIGKLLKRKRKLNQFRNTIDT